MKSKILALTGKGGVGKTSLSAIIVKILSEDYKDKKILAIDADPAIGLATALGVDVKITLDDIRTEIINTVEGGDTKTALELVGESRYKIAEAIVEKDNFAFLAIGRPETKGCYCRINSYLKSVIETVGNQFDYIVIDCEAGIEQAAKVLRSLNPFLKWLAKPLSMIKWLASSTELKMSPYSRTWI